MPWIIISSRDCSGVCFFRQQERIASDREEIERQRKVLSKKKPTASGAAGKGPKNAREADGFLKPSEKP